MSDYLIVKSSVRKAVGDLHVADGFVDKLNEVVVFELREAIRRAEQNGRRTLMARDL